MSKNNKAKKSVEPKLHGLESLSALLAPEPDDVAIEIALETLMADPAFVTIDLAAAKLDEAAKLTVQAKELEEQCVQRMKHLGDVVIDIDRLQKSILGFKSNLRERMLKSDLVTKARALWEGDFSKNLDRAVEEGTKRSPVMQKLQEELGQAMAEAEKIRNANDAAKAEIVDFRALSDLCAKEAGNLLASVQ